MRTQRKWPCPLEAVPFVGNHCRAVQYIHQCPQYLIMSAILSALRDTMGLCCPKCDDIIKAVNRETKKQAFCDLGKLEFNPACSLCGFFRQLCQRMIGV